MGAHPSVVVLAGPNGAGKTTAAPLLLRDVLGVTAFVNTDLIGQGLSVFDPAAATLAAGRAMLARLRELARQRASFAFETTLASRLFAPWLADLAEAGYSFHLVFLWVPSPEFALERVATRVRLGGHDIPADTVRRRYVRGLRNFFDLYRPLTTTWRMYDNSVGRLPKLVAVGRAATTDRVLDEPAWELIQRGAHDRR